MLAASLFFTGAIATDALVKGWTPPNEDSISLEDNGENPLGIVIEPSKNDSMDRMNIDQYPDLGSDQVFPFAAGLDSY